MAPHVSQPTSCLWVLELQGNRNLRVLETQGNRNFPEVFFFFFKGNRPRSHSNELEKKILPFLQFKTPGSYFYMASNTTTLIGGANRSFYIYIPDQSFQISTSNTKLVQECVVQEISMI